MAKEAGAAKGGFFDDPGVLRCAKALESIDKTLKQGGGGGGIDAAWLARVEKKLDEALASHAEAQGTINALAEQMRVNNDALKAAGPSG